MNLQAILIFWELSGRLQSGTIDLFTFYDLLFELFGFIMTFFGEEDLFDIC